jgi:hypothetical protein
MKKYTKIALFILPLVVLAVATLAVSECQAKTQATVTAESTSSSQTHNAVEAMDSDVVFQKDTLQIKKQDGEILNFNVELATTDKERAQGLMYRTELGDNEGMLFIFDDVYRVAFWMKNTLIPLDMLFIHPDGVIHHIHHNAKPQDLTQISSEFPAIAVFEVPGGLSARMGITEGDQILHPAFKTEVP